MTHYFRRRLPRCALIRRLCHCLRHAARRSTPLPLASPSHLADAFEIESPRFSLLIFAVTPFIADYFRLRDCYAAVMPITPASALRYAAFSAAARC